MKLSAQLYTVRDFTKNQEEIKSTLEKVKKIGYNSVQISGLKNYDPYWLTEVLAELQLEVCASHTSIDRIVNDTENVIKEHKAWGCRYIGLGYTPYTKKEEYDRLYAQLDTPIKKIADSGLLFLHHNHAFELGKVSENSDDTFLDFIADKYPADMVGFLIDFYWTTYAGYDFNKIIDKFGDRLKVVHFKDLKVDENGNKVITEIGNGIINYKEIFKRLLNTKNEFVAIEQDNNFTVSAFDSLKTSYENVNKIADFEM